MFAEQAIFTSTQTAELEGYHLVARSRGISEPEARVLRRWCPSHNSLADEAHGCSTNSHPLGAGRWCISRSAAWGAEFSGRGGTCVYTHCLVMNTEDLRRYRNDPLVVTRWAEALGHLRHRSDFRKELEPVELPNIGGGEDWTAVRRFWRELGGARLEAVLDAIVGHAQTLIVSGSKPEALLKAILACVPVKARLLVSFSSALKPSRQRPFRLVVLPTEGAYTKPLGSSGWAWVDLTQRPAAKGKNRTSAWARVVAEAVDSENVDALRRTIEMAGEAETLEDLERIAESRLPEACGVRV